MLKNKGELRLQEVYLFKYLNLLFFKFINFMLDQGTIGCPGRHWVEVYVGLHHSRKEWYVNIKTMYNIS